MDNFGTIRHGVQKVDYRIVMLLTVCYLVCCFFYAGEMGQHDKKMEKQQINGAESQTLSHR